MLCSPRSIFAHFRAAEYRRRVSGESSWQNFSWAVPRPIMISLQTTFAILDLDSLTGCGGISQTVPVYIFAQLWVSTFSKGPTVASG